MLCTVSQRSPPLLLISFLEVEMVENQRSLLTAWTQRFGAESLETSLGRERDVLLSMNSC